MIFFLASAVGRPSSGPELIGDAVAGERGVVGGAAAPVGGRDHLDDGHAELLGEREVALVVRRHRHDGAGAVGRQHVVGDPDRDLLAVDRD